MKKNIFKYLFNISLLLFCSFGMIHFLMGQQSASILKSLSSIKLLPFLLIFGYAQITQVLNGITITSIVRTMHRNYAMKDGLISTMVCNFFSGITPSATGGQFGQLYVFQKQGLDLHKGTSVIWYDFFIYQNVMILFVFLLLLLQNIIFPGWQTPIYFLIIIGFIIQASIIIILLTMVFFPSFYLVHTRNVLEFIHRYIRLKKKEQWIQMMEEQVLKCKDNVALFASNKKLLAKIIILNLVKLIIYYSIPVAIALAMGIDLSAKMGFQLLSLTAFVSMANAFFPIPGASGGTEVIFTLVTTPLLGFSSATAIMLIWRITTYYASTITGGFAFLGFKLFKKKPSSLLY